MTDGPTQSAGIALPLPVPLVISGVEFDAYHYYEAGDILYIRVEDDAETNPWYDSTLEERDAFRCTVDGRLHNLILMSPRHWLELEGELRLTFHRGGPTTVLSREIVEPMLIDTPIPDLPDIEREDAAGHSADG